MVVGSFASGSDLARQLASLNLADDQPPTKVYVSSSGDTSYATRDGEWAKFVIDVPIIRKVVGKRIELENGEVVDDVDVVIFATGYYYSLPFCKRADAPWDQVPVLDEEIEAELANGHTGSKTDDREDGDSARNGAWVTNGHAYVNGHTPKLVDGHGKRDEGGIRGFHMDNLDPLLLFLRTDRSIAFPTLRTCSSPAASAPSNRARADHCRIPSRPLPARRDPSPSPRATLGWSPPLVPFARQP